MTSVPRVDICLNHPSQRQRQHQLHQPAFQNPQTPLPSQIPDVVSGMSSKKGTSATKSPYARASRCPTFTSSIQKSIPPAETSCLVLHTAYNLWATFQHIKGIPPHPNSTPYHPSHTRRPPNQRSHRHHHRKPRR